MSKKPMLGDQPSDTWFTYLVLGLILIVVSIILIYLFRNEGTPRNWYGWILLIAGISELATAHRLKKGDYDHH